MNLAEYLTNIGEGTVDSYRDHVSALNADTRGQAMMGRIIGLVVAVSVGLVITFNLLPTVFDQYGDLEIGETESVVPENLEGIVELVPVFGVLAIALVFLGALMFAIRDVSNGSGGGF